MQKNEFELLLIIYTLFFSYVFGSDASSSSRKHGFVEFFLGAWFPTERLPGA